VKWKPKLQRGKGFDWSQDEFYTQEQRENDEFYTQEQCENDEFYTQDQHEISMEDEEDEVLPDFQRPQRSARCSFFGCGAPEIVTSGPHGAFRRTVEPVPSLVPAALHNRFNATIERWGWEIFG